MQAFEAEAAAEAARKEAAAKSAAEAAIAAAAASRRSAAASKEAVEGPPKWKVHRAVLVRSMPCLKECMQLLVCLMPCSPFVFVCMCVVCLNFQAPNPRAMF